MQGVKGVKGDTGEKGAKGDTGPAGRDGDVNECMDSDLNKCAGGCIDAVGGLFCTCPQNKKLKALEPTPQCDGEY